MARSTEHLPKYAPQSWDYYSPGMSDPFKMSKQDLIKVVRKAAKAANQRLRSLEKNTDVNERTAGGYKYASTVMPDKSKPRFKERTEKLEIGQLRQEYLQLRQFMTMKTSTPTGVKSVKDARYQTAKQQGFNGTQEDWDNAVQRFFTEKAEKLFDSKTIYSAITENNTDVLQDIIDADADNKRTRGQALLDYLRRLDE